MRKIGLAIVAGLAMALSAGAANAAEMPMSATKAQMAGMSGIELPIAAKTDKTDEIVVARRGLGRGLAIGALIVGGAIIASEAARADRRRARRHRRRCDRWLRKCEYGNDRACWRYDNRC